MTDLAAPDLEQQVVREDPLTSPGVVQIHKGPVNGVPADFRVTTGHPDDPSERSPVTVTVHGGSSGFDIYVVSAPWLNTHVFRGSGSGYYRRLESLGPAPLPALRAVLAVVDARESWKKGESP